MGMSSVLLLLYVLLFPTTIAIAQTTLTTDVHSQHEHPFILIAVILFMAITQLALYYWNHHHNKSYKQITLAAMFIIPLILSISLVYWRMITIWTLFTVITAYLLKQASNSPIPRGAPRQIYSWFMLIHRICALLAATGYTLIIMQFLLPLPLIDTGILFLFYGLYFGVLLRDCSEIAADRIASHMGYFSKDGFPSREVHHKNLCAVCNALVKEDANSIEQNTAALISQDDDSEALSFLSSPSEEAFKLDCGHIYHEFCLRGWVIIGKKDTCAQCMEKVCLEKIFGTNPWQRHSLAWGQVLDIVRYFVAWNPIILFASGVFVRIFHRD